MNRSQVISQIREALHRLAPALGLFFTEVRQGGCSPDSDIDLLLLLDKDVITLEDRMALTAPLYDIELQTGIQINPFIESMRKWGKRFTTIL